VFQETGGRTIEVTNREYQLRGVINNDDIDKARILVVGATRTKADLPEKTWAISRSDTICDGAR
jgi:hypothetical protein